MFDELQRAHEISGAELDSLATETQSGRPVVLRGALNDLAAALVAELEPGDAIYIPYLWGTACSRSPDSTS